MNAILPVSDELAGEQFQMEKGIFDVKQDGVIVGKLWVIGPAGSDNKIEYWYLFDNSGESHGTYRRPGRANDPKTIELDWRQDSPAEFDDEDARDQSTALANEGKSHVRIKAVCTRQS